MSNEDDIENLNHSQRLKAAVHYTTMKICQEHTAEKDLHLNRMVVAAISETTWKKFEEFALDLEAFAKHAKRTTITADDVKLLVRRTPRLYEHIAELHGKKTAGKAETKKKVRKTKTKNTTSSTAVASTSNVVNMDADEDSRT